MAFYARKKNMELWNAGVFYQYGFCLCCKREVSPGEHGFISKKGNKADKSVLCDECQKQWKEISSCLLSLYKIPRFKK